MSRCVVGWRVRGRAGGSPNASGGGSGNLVAQIHSARSWISVSPGPHGVLAVRRRADPAELAARGNAAGLLHGLPGTVFIYLPEVPAALTGGRTHGTRPPSGRFERVAQMKAVDDAGSSRSPFRHTRRTRPNWQYRNVQALSGLLPPSPPPRGSGCPQLQRPAATGHRRRFLTSTQANNASRHQRNTGQSPNRGVSVHNDLRIQIFGHALNDFVHHDVGDLGAVGCYVDLPSQFGA
jgi:hypothetical protein